VTDSLNSSTWPFTDNIFGVAPIKSWSSSDLLLHIVSTFDWLKAALSGNEAIAFLDYEVLEKYYSEGVSA